jgi:hypothetical protein
MGKLHHNRHLRAWLKPSFTGPDRRERVSDAGLGRRQSRPPRSLSPVAREHEPSGGLARLSPSARRSSSPTKIKGQSPSSQV